MFGLTSLEVCNTIFDKTQEINKFDFYAATLDEVLFTELNDWLEEILDISNISHEYHKIKKEDHVLIMHKENYHQKKRQTDSYYVFFMGYALSQFRE